MMKKIIKIDAIIYLLFLFATPVADYYFMKIQGNPDGWKTLIFAILIPFPALFIMSIYYLIRQMYWLVLPFVTFCVCFYYSEDFTAIAYFVSIPYYILVRFVVYWTEKEFKFF